MDDLYETLLTIGRHKIGPITTADPAGPNDWDTVSLQDFGPDEDYRIIDRGEDFVLTPVSKAATQWVYRHLPEHSPRYGLKGFIIDSQYITLVVAAMRRDKLMSSDEYNEAMEESNAQALQGE